MRRFWRQKRHTRRQFRVPTTPLTAAIYPPTWTLLAIAIAIVWFANLDVRKLQHPDEGRYAEIAREMVASGDWVTPRLNGIKYFEKPPLQYWLTAAAFRAFELDEWTARLPGALAGFLTILIVGYVGSIVASKTAGAYAALALAGCVWPFGIAHLVTLDALLTFWLTAALGAFLLAQHWRADATRSRRWMLVAWAATAGGMMTKGLVALVIPFATLVIHTLLTRDRTPWSRVELLRGLALFLLLAAPWFVVVSARNPEFARFFFIHEHFERFLTTEHRRTGAWWYFLPMLAIGLLPWTGVFLWGLRRSWTEPVAAGSFAWTRFCLVWCAFVLVFFSISGSKLPSYILPIFPAAALVLGVELERMSPRTLAVFAALIASTTCALWLGAVLGWTVVTDAFSDGRTPRELFVTLGWWVKVGLGVGAVGYGVGWLLLRRGTDWGKTAGIAALSMATILMLQAIYSGSDVFRATRSAADLVTTLENTANPPYDRSAPFFQVHMYDQTLPFYLERTTTLVEYRDELGPGLDAQPELAIAREADWIERWKALPQAYALMSHETHDALATAGVPSRVVASDPRRVLIARR
jgi:4-amino-4-deoxy-L-arabinose transferase-like glycosyltransferase